MVSWLKDAIKTRPPNWEDIIYYIVSMFLNAFSPGKCSNLTHVLDKNGLKPTRAANKNQ